MKTKENSKKLPSSDQLKQSSPTPSKPSSSPLRGHPRTGSEDLENERPKAYKQGWIEFYKLRLKVTADVLIPRPETELLVDAVLLAKPKTLIEVGTGSGNIAIAVAKNLPGVKIIATDVSEKAIKVARQNAKLHGVTKQISFMVTNLIEDLKSTDIPDIMVANLPYIPSERISYLDESVKDFEPWVALDGGNDGFELYRQLFVQMIQKKILPKYLIAEIDYTHADIGRIEAMKYFPKCQPEIKLDLTHRQRFLVIKF